jgi:hypothetical protein
MAKSNNAFIKKQKEQQRRKKRQEKEDRKEERKKNSKGGALQDMIVYVDENGQFTNEPPRNFKAPSSITSNSSTNKQ